MSSISSSSKKVSGIGMRDNHTRGFRDSLLLASCSLMNGDFCLMSTLNTIVTIA